MNDFLLDFCFMHLNKQVAMEQPSYGIETSCVNLCYLYVTIYVMTRDVPDRAGFSLVEAPVPLRWWRPHV